MTNDISDLMEFIYATNDCLSNGTFCANNRYNLAVLELSSVSSAQLQKYEKALKELAVQRNDKMRQIYDRYLKEFGTLRQPA